MAFSKKLREVFPGRELEDCAYESNPWWTGKMVESVELIEGFKTRESKNEATFGREVCLIPEIRNFPDLSKEKQFSVTYTTKDEGVITRDQYYRKKGFMPLEDAPQEIQDMAKKCLQYNKKNAKNLMGGRERFKAR